NLQNEVFDIDLWCSEMAVSRSKLNNKIKAISGLTLNDFIMQVKLNRSCKLLISAPELTIAEIAYQCGFTSSSYFGKCFKARYNISPKDYRSKG
ncbi:MAG: helix-turn-helix domain-containing protein, partial [Bacteroides sp.]